MGSKKGKEILHKVGKTRVGDITTWNTKKNILQQEIQSELQKKKKKKEAFLSLLRWFWALPSGPTPHPSDPDGFPFHIAVRIRREGLTGFMNDVTCAHSFTTLVQRGEREAGGGAC
jgi:hypothetical protein